MIRRTFGQLLLGVAGFAFVPRRGSASTRVASPPGNPLEWRSGAVRHILPTVSDRKMLLKVSFEAPRDRTPVLRIDGREVVGVRTDTDGETWQFHASGLASGTTHELQLFSGSGRSQPLCDPWPLRTFPSRSDEPDHARVLFYTCAGGHEDFGFLPYATRRRLLRRALSFAPDAVVANGDHVYWDLETARPSARALRSGLDTAPDHAQPVAGTINETFIKRFAAPQVTQVYGTDFRSTPTFFIQDDHDYYENDIADEGGATFPPNPFMVEMARETQRMLYPEFLPDEGRPADLTGSTTGGVAQPVSESFGTLRYGRLLEALLYTVRRTMTLTGPDAVFVEPAAEDWLVARMEADEVAHVVNVPSGPFGWTAGKWGEWYPDQVGANGELSATPPKPFWQSGWLKQHDRLLSAMARMTDRIPLTIGGDLHASAYGVISPPKAESDAARPVHAVLCGTIGTGTGWPSRSRGVPPTPSGRIEMDEVVAPVEQHGFTIADFTPGSIRLRLFAWDRARQTEDAIDTLKPLRDVKSARS